MRNALMEVKALQSNVLYTMSAFRSESRDWDLALLLDTLFVDSMSNPSNFIDSTLSCFNMKLFLKAEHFL